MGPICAADKAARAQCAWWSGRGHRRARSRRSGAHAPNASEPRACRGWSPMPPRACASRRRRAHHRRPPDARRSGRVLLGRRRVPGFDGFGTRRCSSARSDSSCDRRRPSGSTDGETDPGCPVKRIWSMSCVASRSSTTASTLSARSSSSVEPGADDCCCAKRAFGFRIETVDAPAMVAWNVAGTPASSTLLAATYAPARPCRTPRSARSRMISSVKMDCQRSFGDHAARRVNGGVRAERRDTKDRVPASESGARAIV